MLKTMKLGRRLLIISLHKPGAVKGLKHHVGYGRMMVCNTPFLSIVIW